MSISETKPYLTLEVLWNANSANGFRLEFRDKDAERAHTAIENFRDEAMADLHDVGGAAYVGLMTKFARRVRWASVQEKTIAAINLAAMIETGVVVESPYNRITQQRSVVPDFGSVVSDQIKANLKSQTC